MHGNAADLGGVHTGFDTQHRRFGNSGRCISHGAVQGAIEADPDDPYTDEDPDDP